MNSLAMRIVIATVAGALVVSAAPAGRAADISASTISYISGGIGLVEREAFLARQGEFNLKLVTSVVSGNFLADVQVMIESAGHQPMLRTTMDGPFLLAKLPPGTYTVRATFQADTLTRTVNVPARGLVETPLVWNLPG